MMHSAAVRKNKKRVLIVEDDRTLQALLVAQIEALGHEVQAAENGAVALERLKSDMSYDIAVLDRQMPEMDGIALVQAMKRDRALRKIPVIMQTGLDKPHEVQQGIDAGVFYYLTKPIDPEVLKSVLASAIRDIRQHETYQEEIQQQKTSLRLLEKAQFRLQTLDEAESLACVVASCYKHSERVVLGLAELMVNAVEHGNLTIGYEEKTRLIAQGGWRDEIERRLTLPENQDKYVEVTLSRDGDMVSITVTDQGEGFNWRNYMEIDPARVLDNHGRGIAQANAISFDSMKYNDIGNQVTAQASDNTQPDW